MSARVRSRRRSKRGRNVRRSRRLILLWLGGLVVVLVAAVAWVGVRFALSASELSSAQREAKQVVARIAADPRAAASETRVPLQQLDRRLSTARGLTGDPVWRAAEAIPFAGDNLRAYRLTVDGVATAVHDGLVPALPALGDLGSALSLTDGSIDLSRVSSGAGALRRATTALQHSERTLSQAQEGAVVPALAQRSRQAGSLIGELSRTVGSLSTAADVLPSALGAEGSRRYGMLFNNNGELRSTGGIAGAISELTADGGRLALGRQLTPADLNRPDQPLPVTDQERTLFQHLPGQYVQDVNLTPDFPRSGQLTAAMWYRSLGQPLDGVVSIDAVTIGRLLEATGPITVDGQELTARNATEQLLSAVYWRLPDPADQDAFFADVTRTMFDRVLHGGAPLDAVLSALDGAAKEGRISVWFADPVLERAVEGTPVAGPLDRVRPGGSPVGVFLADGTGSKLSYYLAGAVEASECVAGATRTITVTATLRSTAPADIASAPWYVTGAGATDVPVGSMRTVVVFAAADGTRLQNVRVDGADAGTTPVAVSGRALTAAQADLAPGASATFTATLRVLPGHDVSLDDIVTTPTAGALPVTVGPARCG